jgi:prepilin signal peptidase PulO-like enzyme (type II secretory pathway)
MTLFLPLIFGLLGLFLGSFANVVSLRLHSHKSGIFFGRSACPKCNHQLSWYENLPVVSWLFLRGKCKNCKQPISWQYPATELFFGVLFFTVAFLTPLENHILLAWHLLLFFALGILVLSDLRYMDLPDKVTIPTIAFLLITISISHFFFPAEGIPSLWNSLLGAVSIYGFLSLFILLPGILKSMKIKKIKPLWDALSSLFLLPLWIVANILFLKKPFEKIFKTNEDEEEIPAWVGGGDLRLVLIMGLLLGVKMSFVALFLAFFTASLVVMPVHFFQTKKESMFPFGPFLILGTFLTLFWGENILGWYLQLIGVVA